MTRQRTAAAPPLLERRLLFITGKGGVGKSAVTAALACLLARRKKRVLIVEVDAPRSRMADWFGQPHIGYQPVPLDDHLNALCITPSEAMEEYLSLVLRFRFVYRRVLNNALFRAFSRAVPGLDDLITIGKIGHLAQQTDGDGKPIWEHIVVDAPATGHSVAFLHAPQATIDTVRVGPVAASAKPHLDLVRDARRTAVCLVALPEELPVNETEELHRRLTEVVQAPLGWLFVNAVSPQPFDSEERAFLERAAATGLKPASEQQAAAVLEAARLATARADLERRHLDRLRQAIPLPMLELPYLFTEHFGRPAIEQLADCLAEGLSP